MLFLDKNIVPRLRRLFLFYRKLIGLRAVAMMIVSSIAISVLEMGGFALLLPYIKLITDVIFFQQLFVYFENTVFQSIFRNREATVIICSVILLIGFLVKAALYTSLVKFQAKIGNAVNAQSSKELINSALRSRYQLFLDVGAVKIAGMAHSNTAHAALLFQSVVSAINEAVFLALILISLLILAPKIMLTVLGLIVILLFSVFIPLSRRTAQIGTDTTKFDALRHRFVYTMANAIRDIKIMALESLFIRRNEHIVDGATELVVKYQTISALLRTLIETVMLCSIVVAGIWFEVSGANLVEVAPLIAILGLIAVRTAPAFSRLVSSYNSFRLSLPVVEALLNMFDTISHYSQPKVENGFDYKKDYVVSGLKFGYGAQLVINDTGISIPHGSVVAVVGASGSGKSTLLDLLVGLQKPLDGKFTIGGVSFEPFRSLDFCPNVGYVPQSIAFLDATLEFNICLEAQPDPVRLEAAIKRAQLTQLISSLPQGLKTLMGEGATGLSGGQRQRVGIARALYRGPNLLILDEVTSALDETTSRAIIEDLLALRGETSLLFVTHELHLLSVDFIYEMVEGRLKLLKAESAPSHLEA